MQVHCGNERSMVKIFCNYKKCNVCFKSIVDKVMHMTYVLEKPYGKFFF